MRKKVAHFRLYHRFTNWVGYWIDLICTIIRIVTLDSYYPNWDIYYRCRIARWGMKERLATLEANSQDEETKNGGSNEHRGI